MQKTANPTSRLMQMQAQYQQRQMAEREHKIASLYEAQQARALERVRHSASTTGTSTSSPSPPLLTHGKVRQMFEERRSKGIDKSYPLQPIHNNNLPRKPSTSSRLTVEKKRSTVTHTQQRRERQNIVVQQRTDHRSVNGTTAASKPRDLNHNHQPDLNGGKQVIKRGSELENLTESELRALRQMEALDRLDEGCLIQDETCPEELEPATPDLPPTGAEGTRAPALEPKRPPRKNTTVKTTAAVAAPAPAPVPPPRRSATDQVTNSKRQQPPMQRTSTHPRSPRKPASATGQPGRAMSPAKARSRPPAGGGGVTVTAAALTASGGGGGGGGGGSAAGDGCAVCGRHFAPDRLARHEEICRRTANKKRKPFDALKHRLEGTEAEPFLNKIRKTGTIQSKGSAAPKSLNTNWRKQHQEFINAIRAAKQVQAHVAAGGKLSDLPPPPPSENPDYVQCPHCNRRFNQGAAERHIPKCANYQFNKPKPHARK